MNYNPLYSIQSEYIESEDNIKTKFEMTYVISLSDFEKKLNDNLSRWKK